MSRKEGRIPRAVVCDDQTGTASRREGDELLKVRTETLPSEEAQARMGPSSCGAQAIAFTAP